MAYEYFSCGLSWRVRGFCDYVHLVADSLSEGLKINLPQPDVYLCPPLNYFTALDEWVKVQLVHDCFFLNGKLISGEDLQLDIYTFIRASPKVVVALDIDDESDYDHYIQLKNILLRAYYNRRDELVHERFGGTYREYKNKYDNHANDVKRYIREICPIHIIEWSDDEKIVLNYIRSHQKK